jgi:putative peptide maturation system protein
MNPETLPLADALARLDHIHAHALAPEQALASLHELRARYPELRIELVWEDDFGGRPQYELMMGARGDATACLALVPPETSPFAMRGSQRWTEAQLVCVDGRRVFVHEAMVLLDGIWDEARVLGRLVDCYVVARELERHAFTIDDVALQRAVDRFRSERGLLEPDQTRRWLVEHGLTLAELERALSRQLAEVQLRRTLVGPQIELRFTADPSAWDTVGLVAFPAEDLQSAHACVDALEHGVGWMDVAERTLGPRAGSPRGARSMSFETLRRHEIAALDGGQITEGCVRVAELSGRGPYVIAVRSVAPAMFDDRTRDAIEAELFAAWLAEARSAAHVVWNWGPREDGGG